MTVWMIIIIITLIGVSAMIITNLLNQIRQLEKIVQETDQTTYNTYTFILKTLTETFAELQRIDKRGAFSSDDEVGFVFRVIVESIEHVKFQLEKLNKPDDDEVE